MGIFDPHPGVHRHGMEWPPNRLQIFEAVVVTSSIALFAGVCVPVIDEPSRHIIGGSYGLSVIILVLSAGYVARVDPSAKEDKLADEAWNKGPWCGACNLHKQFRTEHCSFCNRCTANFDHHCIWLNNCVGGANYRAFAITLVSVAVMTGIMVSTCLGLVATFPQRSIEDDVGMKAILITSITVLIILNFPLLILDLNLMIFHIGIRMKYHMTTMEYLRACNAWEKERALQYEMPTSAPQVPADTKAFRPFPMWCDWVILRRRGKPPPKTKIAPNPASAPAPAAVANAQPALRETASAKDVESPAPVAAQEASWANLPVAVAASQELTTVAAVVAPADLPAQDASWAKLPAAAAASQQELPSAPPSPPPSPPPTPPAEASEAGIVRAPKLEGSAPLDSTGNFTVTASTCASRQDSGQEAALPAS